MAARYDGSMLNARTLTLAALLLTACRHTTHELPPRAPEGIERFGSGPVLRYLILGDSTAVSQGGTYDRGIARETARHLGLTRAVELKNVAVSGARIGDVLTEQLPRAAGFIPDVVLLDAGANDVVHLTSAAAADRQLQEILRALISRNCNVKIVLTGAADMSSPPRIPRLLRALARRRTSVLNGVVARAVQRHDLTFAHIARETGPLFRSDRSLSSEDRFHPNDRGYAAWIEVIDRALDEALATQPGHCAGPA